MNTQRGIVEKAQDDCAWVVTRRGGACGHCGHKNYWQMVEGMDRLTVKAKNVADAEEGDEVELYLNAKTKFKGFFVLYILPVLGLLIGAFSANSLSRLLGLNANLGLVLFTFSGLALAMLLARFLSNRMQVRGELMPTVTRVLRRSNRASHAIPTEAPTCACSVSGGGRLP